MDIVKLKKMVNVTTNIDKYVLAIRTKPNLNKEETQQSIEKTLKEQYNYAVDYNLVYFGNLDKYPDYKKVVTKFKKKAHGGISIYRNYCTTEEKQRKSMGYCNVAEDAHTSFNTVMSALGSKFGAIITIETNDKSFNDLIQKG